jgi:hypothetical protein
MVGLNGQMNGIGIVISYGLLRYGTVRYVLCSEIRGCGSMEVAPLKHPKTSKAIEGRKVSKISNAMDAAKR